MYAGKIRIRALGVLKEQNRLLLVQLLSPISNELIWTPPGGGVKTGEPIKKALKREFLEETGLQISVGDLIHINELIEEPFHALEFYFRVQRISGAVKLGSDSEHNKEEQLLKDIAFWHVDDLSTLKIKPSFLAKPSSLFVNDNHIHLHFKDS